MRRARHRLTTFSCSFILLFFSGFGVDLALKITELCKSFLPITTYKRDGVGTGTWSEWKELCHHRVEQRVSRHCSTTSCPHTGLKELSCTGNRIWSWHFISLFCSETISQQSRVYLALNHADIRIYFPCNKREMHFSVSPVPYTAKGPEPHLVIFSNSKITGHLLSTFLQLLFFTIL